MRIDIENLGALTKASVSINGLTVIAGENDTGKSTLSKALAFGLMVAKKVKFHRDNINPSIQFNIINATKIFDVNIFQKKNVDYLDKSNIDIEIDSIHINPKMNFGVSYMDLLKVVKQIKSIPNIVYIETPIIWSFMDTFKNIAQIGQQTDILVDHPYLMNDLSIKLSNKANVHIGKQAPNIKDEIKTIIGGEFKKDDMGKFYFQKDKKRIELINTATGIKYFGILQVLSENGWLSNENVLVLDEPEVHMHPKWQLEMAKIIVKLVKQGLKIIVNSHSPYMIEALKRYSDEEVLSEKSNFYLAENGFIKDEDNLSKIFELLSEPFEEFEKMDSGNLKDE